MAAIPDLASLATATDDTSAPGDIVITQSPTVGTMVGVGVNAVTITATDEAGNMDSCMVNVTVQEPPSTTLAAGDIAFLGYNADGSDSFGFVLLKNIIAGTNIKFSDCGVNNPNTIFCPDAGDGSFTWYAPFAMTTGTLVSLPGSLFPGPIASAGDQILAYQGTQAAPTFISAIHTNVEAGTGDSDWDGSTVMNDESALPNQLTNGVNALRVHLSETEVDNWQFDCSLVPGGSPITGSAAGIAAIVNDLQYWVSREIGEYVPAISAGCSFSVIDPPEVVLSVTSNSGSEAAASVISVTATASAPVVTNQTVDLVVSGAGITMGDYTLSNTTITIPIGMTTGSVTFTVVDDMVVEGGETATLNITNPSSGIVLGNPVSQNITITDNDSAAVTLGNFSSPEDDGSVTVIATLDNAVAGGFTVDVSTADNTAMTSDGDYVPVISQTLTFAGTMGETQMFTVTLTFDTKVESDELIDIFQSNLVANTVPGDSIDITDFGQVNITNDDSALVTIANANGLEDGGAITVTATLDRAVDGGFDVDVSTADGTAHDWG